VSYFDSGVVRWFCLTSYSGFTGERRVLSCVLRNFAHVLHCKTTAQRSRDRCPTLQDPCPAFVSRSRTPSCRVGQGRTGKWGIGHHLSYILSYRQTWGAFWEVFCRTRAGGCRTFCRRGSIRRRRDRRGRFAPPGQLPREPARISPQHVGGFLFWIASWIFRELAGWRATRLGELASWRRGAD